MTVDQNDYGRDELVGKVVEEYFEAVERGETPELEELVERYPDIREILQSVIPALSVTSDSAGQSLDGDLRAQRELGDYRILRQLGRGGMGIVYEAEQISMGRRVALKVLPLAGLVDELKIRRFRNEVRAVASLDHPNIVAVYTIGEERGTHYFAMQLIRGRSLAEVIHSLKELHDGGKALDGLSVSRTMSGEANSDAVLIDLEPTEDVGQDRLAPDKTRDTVAHADDSTIPTSTPTEYFRSAAVLGIQAANALQHAHDHGIIHRDIKPANLLLDTSSKLYVTDFGLARVEADVGVTMTGDLIGTLRYMAPEQALAKRVVVDHRADIYSLGVTLYELLTLQPAYPTSDRQLLMKQIAFEEPSALRRIDPRIPVELETIVQKAMSKDMADRYVSAQELADDLRCFLEHRPIKAKPPTLTQVISKWSHRNPTILWASVVTMFLAAVAFGISTLMVAKQRDETEDQLHVTTITRLASESRAQQIERPILSALLALESVELSQRRDDTILPIAHEALLNVTQHLHIGRNLTGHGTKISDLTMTSDWLVTFGEGKAHLWNLGATKPELSSISLATGGEAITSYVVSDNGRWLAAGGSRIHRWDLNVANPQSSALVSPAASGDKLLGITGDGRWLVSQDTNGTIKRWDLAATSGNPQVIWNNASTLLSYALSADGRWFAATEDGEYRAGLVPTGLVYLGSDELAPPRFLPVESHEQYHIVRISPDEKNLITSVRSKPLFKIWNLEAEDPTASPRSISIPSHVGFSNAEFSSDSKWLLASMLFSSRIHRWDLSNDDIESTHVLVRGHNNEVRSLSLTQDGRWLLSAGVDGTGRLWDMSEEMPVANSLVVKVHDEVRVAAIHPDGKWFATAGSDGTARLWELRGNKSAALPFVLRNEEDGVFSDSAISSSGQRIATCVDPNAVQLWEISDNGLASRSQILKGPESTISAIAMSPDDRWLVAGCRDSVAYVWDLTRADTADSLRVLGTPIDSRSKPLETGLVAIGPNSRWLALASGDSNIRLWDIGNIEPLASHRVLRGHTEEIKSLLISPDGRWLAAGVPVDDGGETVRIWDLSTDDQLPAHALQAGPIYSMSVDAKSRWLATDGPDHLLTLWDLKADNPATSRRIITLAEDGGIWRIAFTPDARWLFTSQFNRTAQLWDLEHDPPKLFELRGHYGVQDAAISPDGRWLATGNRDHGNARLWDLTSRDPSSTARVLRGHDEVVWSVCFSADSRWLVTDASDGTIRRWSLDTDWLLKYTRDVAGRELTEEEREYHGVPNVNQR